MARKTDPPGFRFHPTDEELFWYLKRKVSGKSCLFEGISEIELYKFDPWELPAEAEKSFPESRNLVWYFFCRQYQKHSIGARIDRATKNGFWKSTGKDKSVLNNSRTVGKRKTLVFYTNSASQRNITNWVIHEYRLEDARLANLRIAQDSYVLCKIFEKSGPGPKNGEQYGAPFKEEDWDEVPINGSSLLSPAANDMPLPPGPVNRPGPTLRQRSEAYTPHGSTDRFLADPDGHSIYDNLGDISHGFVEWNDLRQPMETGASGLGMSAATMENWIDIHNQSIPVGDTVFPVPATNNQYSIFKGSNSSAGQTMMDTECWHCSSVLSPAANDMPLPPVPVNDQTIVISEKEPNPLLEHDPQTSGVSGVAEQSGSPPIKKRKRSPSPKILVANDIPLPHELMIYPTIIVTMKEPNSLLEHDPQPSGVSTMEEQSHSPENPQCDDIVEQLEMELTTDYNVSLENDYNERSEAPNGSTDGFLADLDGDWMYDPGDFSKGFFEWNDLRQPMDTGASGLANNQYPIFEGSNSSAGQTMMGTEAYGVGGYPNRKY